eukprot:1111142-Pleurochrysis_carterae.AAC.2
MDCSGGESARLRTCVQVCPRSCAHAIAHERLRLSTSPSACTHACMRIRVRVSSSGLKLARGRERAEAEEKE